MNVNHTCDNPVCCNPAHLYRGTQRQNVDDMMDRDRQRKGTDVHTSKLSEAKVLEIRERYAGGETQAVLGEAYSVSRQMISLIVLRKKWKHI